jgi:sodium transport system ATP-binding protein
MLQVRNLSKSFPVPARRRRAAGPADPRERAGLLHALRPVSFTVERGSIVAILGPNGAGKTTLLRVLATALRPSSGTATLDGVDIVAEPLHARRKLGLLSGSTGLYGRLTAREVLAYHGELHGMSRAAIASRTQELFTRLRLHDAADRRCDALSTGMKQRVSIARTLIHDPEVLVFDEPTTGLDILSARSILELIAEARTQNKTVLLATHHMHEVEALCERAIVLDRGELGFFGTLDELRNKTGESRMDRALLALLDASEANHAA